jgi:hypothetical protein
VCTVTHSQVCKVRGHLMMNKKKMKKLKKKKKKKKMP